MRTEGYSILRGEFNVISGAFPAFAELASASYSAGPKLVGYCQTALSIDIATTSLAPASNMA